MAPGSFLMRELLYKTLTNKVDKDKDDKDGQSTGGSASASRANVRNYGSRQLLAPFGESPGPSCPRLASGQPRLRARVALVCSPDFCSPPALCFAASLLLQDPVNYSNLDGALPTLGDLVAVHDPPLEGSPPLPTPLGPHPHIR